jgi:hypothetical protein
MTSQICEAVFQFSGIAQLFQIVTRYMEMHWFWWDVAAAAVTPEE